MVFFWVKSLEEKFYFYEKISWQLQVIVLRKSEQLPGGWEVGGGLVNLGVGTNPAQSTREFPNGEVSWLTGTSSPGSLSDPTLGKGEFNPLILSTLGSFGQ